MTDAPKNDEGNTNEPPAVDEPKGAVDDKLGEPGLKALQAERDARAAAEAKVREYEQAAQEADRAKLGETERLTLERDEHKTGRESAETRALRFEVALDKGLSATLAKRLTGATREELEADADELVALVAGKSVDKGDPPRSKAREALPRGGGDPDDEPEETDPAKLAAKIPRR